MSAPTPLRLRYYGDPALTRGPAREVEQMKSDPEVQARLRTIVREMFALMYREKGMGLAAPQVGLDIALFIMATDVTNKDTERVFVNPTILNQSHEEETEPERCLSFPGLTVRVSRPKLVRGAWLDLDGNAQRDLLEGLPARCFQHEMDHLSGFLFTDRAIPAERDYVKRQLKKLARRGL